jgi:hypothetical protein
MRQNVVEGREKKERNDTLIAICGVAAMALAFGGLFLGVAGGNTAIQILSGIALFAVAIRLAWKGRFWTALGMMALTMYLADPVKFLG